MDRKCDKMEEKKQMNQNARKLLAVDGHSVREENESDESDNGFKRIGCQQNIRKRTEMCDTVRMLTKQEGKKSQKTIEGEKKYYERIGLTQEEVLRLRRNGKQLK